MNKKRTYNKPVQVTKTGRARIEIPAEIKRDLKLVDKEPACVTTIGDDRILITLVKKKEKKDE